MSADDRPDYARGWRFAQSLLDGDELPRIEARSDEEVDAELRAAGFDPESVPSVEALLAKAAALAAREAPGAADPARGWAFADKLLAEDGEEKLATVHDPPPLASLLARTEELSRREKARNEPSPPAQRSPRRRRTAWLIAAAPAAIVVFFAIMNGNAIAAIVRGQPVKPSDTWLPWRAPPPTPQQRAAALRSEAFAACARQDFSTCEGELDDAAQLDPDGDQSKPVLDARKTIDQWWKAMDPGKKPHLK